MQERVVIGGDLNLRNTISGDLELHEVINGEGGVFMPLNPPAYTGELTVIPSAQVQVLETAGLLVPENIVVEPIPSNYGLITWNGSTITVS